ncbi:hypothetical protein [Mucilaginibacter conchicola]|uniref:hypothetical protein n=1 Tax=Mucilaginibacter conchicola TaxID=2303333 RepID=UPI0018F2DABB|nr:hypothetical protein [Mucilaginibacter conchicola]
MKLRLLLLLFLLSACRHERKTDTAFYYWKTVYKANPAEVIYRQQLHSGKLYVRIMDVDMDETGTVPVPVSPIIFKNKLPDTVSMVPVVFIVNDVLKNITKPALDNLAKKILFFVNGKAEQAGKPGYQELQIDCDWTLTTRDNYFYLLNKIRSQFCGQKRLLSVTLRLHQLKNQKRNGVPPADRVMLMCYNMGNLRKYGSQNSILDIAEMKKYINSNISEYHLPVDIALPLFSWAVAFRNKKYIGIPKQVSYRDLADTEQFIKQGDNMYRAKTELPQYGLRLNDEVRWENSSLPALQNAAKYLSGLIRSDTVNVAYFHLDEATIKAFKHEDLDKITHLFN